MITVLFTLTICLLVSFIFSEIFFRLKYPRVLGYIVAGIVLGYPLLSSALFVGENFFVALNTDSLSAGAIELLSNLGIIFLLLLTGLEINLGRLRKLSKEILLIAVSAAVVPFLCGFVGMRLLGYSNVVAFIVGACLSLTAEGTKDVILMELNKLNTKVGEIMIAAGAVDDIFGTVFLAVILVAAKTERVGLSEFSGLSFLLIEFVIFVVLSYLIFKLLPGIIHFIQEERSEISEFSTIIIIGLLIATLSGFLGLGTILGALIAGVLLQLTIKDRKIEQQMVKDLRVITLGLIIPFFFISVGLKFWSINLGALSLNDLSFFVLIILIATVGKVLGSIIVKPFTSLSMRQLYLIGWGMNSRGAIELVIVTIAYPLLIQEGAITVFPAIVVMAIFTTLFFPLILRYEVRKYPDIMD